MASGRFPQRRSTSPTSPGRVPPADSTNSSAASSRRQDVQRDRLDAVQLHHPPAAGDHDEGLAGAGQQIAHVIGVGGVVQQHDRAPRRQLRPPQRGPLGDPVGNPAGRQSERGQQHPQRLRGLDPLPARREPVQVQVELATGEVGGQQVRGVYGQRGLPHPAHAVDRHHRRVPRGAEEGVQLRPAPGEGGDVVWQVVAHRGSGGRARLGPVLGPLPHLTQRPGVTTGRLAQRHHRRPGWNGLAGEVARQRGAADMDVAGELAQAPSGQVTQLP